MCREGKVAKWLDLLLEGTMFFTKCELHNRKKHCEANIYCLYCCAGFCARCIPYHKSHRRFKIRRFSDRHTVKLEDLERLIDCSLIRVYQLNGMKLIFVEPKPKKENKISMIACLKCGIEPDNSMHYCSLTCKVDHLISKGSDISTIMVQFDETMFKFGELDVLQTFDTDAADDYVSQYLTSPDSEHE